jgi:hypothetical protein
MAVSCRHSAEEQFNMVTRWSFLPLAASVLALNTGCDSSGLYPVTGQVQCNGQPAAGATVTFVRKDAANRLDEQTPLGVVQEDGTFTLTCPSGKGAAPGEYIVLIEWKEGAGHSKGRTPALNAPDRLKRKYLDPNKPLLTATVAPKTNRLPPFEVN